MSNTFVFVVCDMFYVVKFVIFIQIRFSKFPKVVQQHMQGVIKIIKWILLEISFTFQQ